MIVDKRVMFGCSTWTKLNDSERISSLQLSQSIFVCFQSPSDPITICCLLIRAYYQMLIARQTSTVRQCVTEHNRSTIITQTIVPTCVWCPSQWANTNTTKLYCSCQHQTAYRPKRWLLVGVPWPFWSLCPVSDSARIGNVILPYCCVRCPASYAWRWAVSTRSVMMFTSCFRQLTE